MTSRREEEFTKWVAQEQKYQDDIRCLDNRIKFLTHELEQSVFKLDEQTKNVRRLNATSLERQKEVDEQYDSLKAEKRNLEEHVRQLEDKVLKSENYKLSNLSLVSFTLSFVVVVIIAYIISNKVCRRHVMK